MTRLGAVVQQALDHLEWQDEISLDARAGTSQVLADGYAEACQWWSCPVGSINCPIPRIMAWRSPPFSQR